SGTVREMSDWIEYLTRADDSPMAALRRENGRDEPWTVPFFGIGNEAWGCGGNMCAEDYAALARQYATYVRDHGDNQVTRIAAGASDGDYAWTEALMRAIDGLEGRDGRPGPFQAISLHYYTMSGPCLGATPRGPGRGRTRDPRRGAARWGGTAPPPARPSPRSSWPATRPSWTATTRTARWDWSSTSGAPGGTWSPAPTPASCT